MKTASISLLSLLFLLMVSCNSSNKNGKTIGNLQLSETTPHPGDVVDLNYTPLHAKEAEDDLTAYYYTLVNDKAYVKEVDLEKNDKGVLKGKITIPDSATAIAFNFEEGDKFLTNDGLGYVQPLYTQEGKILPKSFTSISYFLNQVQRDLGVDHNPDTTLTWLKGYLKSNPEIKNEDLGQFARLLYTKDSAVGKAYIDGRLAMYAKKKELSQKDYEGMVSLYRILRDKKKADSISKIVAQKFPKSQAAQVAVVMNYQKAKTPEDKKAIYKKYVATVGNDGIYKAYMLGTLARQALGNNDIDTYKKYVEQYTDNRLKALSYSDLATHYEKANKLDKAAKTAKKALAIMNLDKNKSSISYYTKEQYGDLLERYARGLHNTYAGILFKQGKIKKAIEEQEEAVNNGDNQQYNEDYITYLLAGKQYEEAEEEAADFIKDGKATAKVKEGYKIAYVKHHGNKDGLDASLAGLEKQAHQKLVATVKKEMFTKKAPNLALVDNEGNKITLADLKGKTVVLDFWATWCGPCRASFPGMKKAVQFYKDSTNVQFYFVNTFQREPTEERHKKVNDFIKKNNYPFEVLYDQSKDNKFLTAAAFGITGIPTKIIIDKNGNWRFTKVGWYGSTPHLVKEVKAMISLLN